MLLIRRKSDHIIAALLIIAVLASYGIFMSFLRPAKGATLTSIKDTISTSAPSTPANHVIQFTTPTGIASGTTITVTFPGSFTGTTSIGVLDVDLATGTNSTATNYSLATAPVNGSSWGVSTSSTALVLTSCGSACVINANTVVFITIGTSTTVGGVGVRNISNPAKSAAVGTADTYTVTIGGTMADSGTTIIAVIEGVTVSVTVAQSLSFNINSVVNDGAGGTASCDSVFSTLGGPNTTSSTVPFGSISSLNTFFHACQDLVVSTNASSGYAVSAQEDTSLKNGSANYLPDTSCDTGTACTASTSGAWATATNNGFGYACSNLSGSNGSCVTTSTTIYRRFACTGAAGSCTAVSGASAINMMSTGTPVNADSSRVEYKLSFNATQAAGAYQNTITYIATPTF